MPRPGPALLLLSLPAHPALLLLLLCLPASLSCSDCTQPAPGLQGEEGGEGVLGEEGVVVLSGFSCQLEPHYPALYCFCNHPAVTLSVSHCSARLQQFCKSPQFLQNKTGLCCRWRRSVPS